MLFREESEEADSMEAQEEVAEVHSQEDQDRKEDLRVVHHMVKDQVQDHMEKETVRQEVSHQEKELQQERQDQIVVRHQAKDQHMARDRARREPSAIDQEAMREHQDRLLQDVTRLAHQDLLQRVLADTIWTLFMSKDTSRKGSSSEGKRLTEAERSSILVKVVQQGLQDREAILSAKSVQEAMVQEVEDQKVVHHTVRDQVRREVQRQDRLLLRDQELQEEKRKLIISLLKNSALVAEFFLLIQSSSYISAIFTYFFKFCKTIFFC